MSWRAIQDDVPYSLSLAALSDGAERLYWRMVSQADPWGRLEVGNPAKLKLRCAPALPWTEKKVAGLLDELVSVNRVQLYETRESPAIGAVLCAQILDWDENQPADVKGRNGKRYQSQLPAPPVLQGTPRGAEGRGVTPPESESESEKLSGANAPSSQVEVVYAHWRQVWEKTDPRYDRISDKRRRRIKDRLHEFPASELCRALDGSRLDPWEDRPRHADLTVLLRDREQVERFLEFAEHPPVNGNGRRRHGGVLAGDILAQAKAEEARPELRAIGGRQ